ncbi:GLPGLI family protein [Mucilaginibacter myungsuensis]|uniref:GLPGLI family protein n=1 Tax=Mucilaginibacter myungsuensis TaxID=649104 RepID=A0A929KTK6_9SPHI|nr:GLPGLI family protein [Mucilaginibacter myungsuensis]MBE9660927.1 GLPGLI family protein [Mucilaginibacter myungsuensis]MDN3600973.1 GLPGLI family protein [Mucilaginibacter myungsuensis]
MKTTLTTLALLLLVNLTFAQLTTLPKNGAITFEKSVNVYALLKKMMPTPTDAMGIRMMDQFKNFNPQFRVSPATLSFGGSKTLYTPDDVPFTRFSNYPIYDNSATVYSDLTAQTTVSQRTIATETILMKDSIRKVKWKLTGEVREIAGYLCKRANGVILDSVYVVAFFTNEIPIPGGPASFSGLPGMILQVTLPRDNVTWKATKVTLFNNTPKGLAAPNKGTTMDQSQYKAHIDRYAKDPDPWRYSAKFLVFQW